MSDMIYKIIPDNYTFVPEKQKAISGAAELLKMYIPAERISWEIFENPAFIDCGENFESVSCPYCGANIEIDAWQDMMSRCYESSNFNDLRIHLSCCDKESSLNELKYEKDCGFARFVIEVLNPEYPPCGHDLHEASKCFGRLTLKIVVSKY